MLASVSMRETETYIPQAHMSWYSSYLEYFWGLYLEEEGVAWSGGLFFQFLWHPPSACTAFFSTTIYTEQKKRHKSQSAKNICNSRLVRIPLLTSRTNNFLFGFWYFCDFVENWYRVFILGLEPRKRPLKGRVQYKPFGEHNRQL